MMNKHELLSRGELYQRRVTVGESPAARLVAQRKSLGELGRLGTQHRLQIANVHAFVGRTRSGRG